MSHIEIVPDQMAGFDWGDKHYQVSPATDVIVRFVDPEYDYLRYLDPEEHAITLHWLGRSALGAIVGWGIPETRQRLKMLECEHEAYVEWQERYGMQVFEEDLAELPDTEEIDRFFGNPD